MISICGLAGLAAAAVVLCFIPPKFQSLTRVEVIDLPFDDTPGQRNNPDGRKNLETVTLQVLRSDRIMKALKEDLRWPDYLEADHAGEEKRQEYIEDVRKRTNVDRAKKLKDQGSDFVTITYKDEDPQRAASFANAIREIWVGQTLKALSEDVKKQIDEERKYLDSCYKERMVAGQNVQRWQQDYNLPPTSQSLDRGNTPLEDPVYKQYESAREEVKRLKSEMEALEFRSNHLRDLYASTARTIQKPVDEKTVSETPQFGATKQLLETKSTLDKEIAAMELELNTFKKAHPKYSSIKRQIDSKQNMLKEVNQKLEKAGLTPDKDMRLTQEVLNPDRIQLQADATEAEIAFKTKKREYERAKVNLEDLETQKESRSTIFARYKQLQEEEKLATKSYETARSNVETKEQFLKNLNNAAFNPYRISDIAVPSEKPVEPPVALYLVGGLVGGAGLGAGWIFLREIARSTYRSVPDASASLSIPILGFVNRMDTTIEVQRLRRRNSIGISTSLAAILLIGGTASLYLLQPKLLPQPMKQAIDSVKSKFK
jgi:capsular polysaccharide biosynthesis protein